MKISRRCIICNREAYKGSVFCKYHYEAYEKLNKTFKIWNERLNISYEKYLILIQKNPYSGKWIKQTASYLREVKKNDL